MPAPEPIQTAWVTFGPPTPTTPAAQPEARPTRSRARPTRRSTRIGPSAPDSGPLTYTFTGIPNGNRTVTLDFAEPVATAAGQRVFNVHINGVIVISNLDIYQTVGPNQALSQSSSVTVSTGQIVIQFAKSAGLRPAIVNALAIE